MNIKSVLILACIIGINALNRDENCSCRLNIQKKIVNGKIVPFNSYPWVTKIRVHINEMNAYIGTATILNNDTLLTSGLAVIFFQNDEYYENPELYEKPMFDLYTKNMITISIKRDGKDEEVHRVAKIIPHPKYRYTGVSTRNITLEENVALIKLQIPLQFDGSIKPACLDSSLQETYQGPLTVVGYGANSVGYFNMTNPDAPLREGSVVDSTHEYCITRGGKRMCVESRKTGQNLCHGDLGSALHQTKNGKTSVVAIESHDKYFEGFGELKCEGSYLSKLSHYMPWIQEHIGNRYCN